MIRRTFAVAALLAACTAVPALADSNPAYDAWAKCKPGAMTTVKGTTEAMGQKTNMTIMTKLVEVTPDKATVEVTTAMEMMGQKMPGQTMKQDIPKEMPKMATSMPNGMKMPEIKKGEETITVLGKSVNCQTAEVMTEQNGMKVTAKTWTSADVPGIVKMSSNSTGAMTSSSTMEVTEFKDGN